MVYIYCKELAIYLDQRQKLLLSENCDTEMKVKILNEWFELLEKCDEKQEDGKICFEKCHSSVVRLLESVDLGVFKQEFSDDSNKLLQWLCLSFVPNNPILISTDVSFRKKIIQLLLKCRRNTCASELLLCFRPDSLYLAQAKALLLEHLWNEHCQLMQLMIDWALQPSTNHNSANASDFISSLVSFPDVAMPLVGTEGRNLFCNDIIFYTAVLQQLAGSLEVLSKKTKNQQTASINLAHIGQTISRMAQRGYHDLVWNVLLSDSLPCWHLLETDPAFCRLFSSAICISKVGAGIDNLIYSLLHRAPHYEHVKRILGPLVVVRSDISELLTVNFVFCRTSRKELFASNLMGYLASSHSWFLTFLKTVLKICKVWGCRSGIRHQSYEQHLYLSRLLVCSGAHLKTKLSEIDFSQYSPFDFLEEFRMKLIEGVTNHLESPIEQTRFTGMAVGEFLTSILFKGDVKLKFDCLYNDEVKQLLALGVVEPYCKWIEPSIKKFDQLEKEVNNLKSELSSLNLTYDKVPDLEEITATENKKVLVASNSDDEAVEELDSDDDELPPLESQVRDVDGSVDIPAPTTVRQCLELLNSREQDFPTDYFQRFVIYLRALPVLIRSSSVDLSPIVVELANRLLCLQCPCRMSDFLAVRIDALVALLVRNPAEIAKFLTSQFYEPQFSISHRLDILKIMTLAAEVLSMPQQATPSKPAVKLALQAEMTNLCHPPETPEWRSIVDQRIKDKTVLIGGGSKLRKPIKQIVTGPKPFLKVAGEFFYPLLRRYDGTSPQLDLVNRDYMVLERLIYSVSIIYHCAVDCPGHVTMTDTLLDFLQAVRNHEQPCVRRAVVYSLGYIFLDVPPHQLTGRFDLPLQEFVRWLMDTCLHDPDAEISRLTGTVLTQINTVLGMDQISQQ